MRVTRLLQGAAAAAMLLAAGPALADPSGLALNRFDPAPAGDRMFGVPSPYAAGDLTPHAMLLLDYAKNPLLIRTVPAGDQVGSVVKNQLYVNLDVGLSLWSRLFIDFNVPFTYQNGDSPSALGQVFTSPQGGGFGDLRIGARLRLWGEYHDPFQIAVGGYLWVPTGPGGSFTGTGEARGLPQVIMGGRAIDRIVWSAALGVEIQSSVTYGGISQGPMFRWGGGVGVLLLDNRHLQIGPEIAGAITPRDVHDHPSNVELLLGARYRVIDDLELGLAAGPGLTSGLGTPQWRGVFSVAYTPEQKKDRDHDGIPDAEDACPDVAGVHSDDPRKNGCPAEADRDGDGIPDAQDACPDVKGVADPDPRKNGCPRTVQITDKEILILEQVQFDVDKATIQKVSDPLLDEVASVLKDHPELLRLEVKGHTDNTGAAARNKQLSAARADAVVKALVKRGIAQKRLSSRGYGQEKPIADNATEAGRHKNRRVQFAILESKPR